MATHATPHADARGSRAPTKGTALLMVWADVPAPGSVTLLDLGAGPGTAAWAATEILGEALGDITLIERDIALVEIGRRLAADGPASIRNARWLNADLVALPEDLPPHDIVCLSYSLNELAPPVRERVIR